MCSPQKGFLLIVPLKATRDSLRFRFWHHTAELDSAVGSTPRWEAHHGVWLSGGMHTVKLDSVVGCTPSQTSSNMFFFSCFCFCNAFRLRFFEKLWSKKYFLYNLWLTVLFSYKYLQASQRKSHWLRNVMHTAESDSAVWCTPWSLTLQRAAHHRVWLQGGWLRSFLKTFDRSGMDTGELDSDVWCTPRSFLKIQILGSLTPMYDAQLHTAELFKNSNISAKSTLNSGA